MYSPATAQLQHQTVVGVATKPESKIRVSASLTLSMRAGYHGMLAQEEEDLSAGDRPGKTLLLEA